jgi:hypothetical protein
MVIPLPNRQINREAHKLSLCKIAALYQRISLLRYPKTTFPHLPSQGAVRASVKMNLCLRSMHSIYVPLHFGGSSFLTDPSLATLPLHASTSASHSVRKSPLHSLSTRFLSYPHSSSTVTPCACLPRYNLDFHCLSYFKNSKFKIQIQFFP